MNVRAKLLLAGLCSVLAAAQGCGGGDEGSGSGGSAGTADASDGSGGSSGGSGGSGGAGGSIAGTGGGGTGGSAGSAGSGGSAGSAGSGGSAGSAGAGGSAGSAGSGGSAGSAGAGGSAGSAGAGGSAGSAGAGGSAGSAGAGGSAGSAGAGGSAGSAGAGGSAGSAGAGGSAGGDASAGAGGTAGGDAGSDAPPGCQTSSECDNSIFCDGAEQCVAGSCVAGTPVTCTDDGASCTLEVCDESSKQCETIAQDMACGDGLYCNGAEKCAPGPGANAAGCVPGMPPTCDDGVACTTNGCDEANDACTFTANHAACSDGQYCNGVEQCMPSQGGCVPGAAVDCEDGIACTQDSCNEALDTCNHAPQDSACNNGVYCDGVEKCDPLQGCIDQADVACADDGVQCTVEACDEASTSCKTTLNNSLCLPGQFCSFGGCVSGTSCTTSAQCNDGIACNGVEVCDTSTNPGVCKPGTAVNCNDFIPCTLDQCQEPTGTCAHTPVSTFCNDGDVCNGSETCSPTLGCQPGTPLACNDGVACTIDTCISTFGCSHAPNDAACQDSSFCNGAETCDAQNGCQPSQSPLVCPDDGIACTTETCSEASQACVSTPNDALCPCGQTCNAQQGGCGNFCTVTMCQGHVYQCGNCLDDDGDCKVDSADEYCIGVCSNNEQGYKGNIPGQNNSPCRMDCYFDQDTGPGNDDCYWNHKCDPYEVPPNYPPSGSKCAYDPNANTPGTNQSCSQLHQTQSQACEDYCGPLTPNGCDCFGCCSIPGAPTTVYLGSENSSGDGTCTLANVGNPLLCKPCTQVPACLNTCETCEICIGKPTLPPGCTQQTCPPGVQLCGQPGQAACPAGYYCVTGCCQPVPS